MRTGRLRAPRNTRFCIPFHKGNHGAAAAKISCQYNVGVVRREPRVVGRRPIPTFRFNGTLQALRTQSVHYCCTGCRFPSEKIVGGTRVRAGCAFEDSPTHTTFGVGTNVGIPTRTAPPRKFFRPTHAIFTSARCGSCIASCLSLLSAAAGKRRG